MFYNKHMQFSRINQSYQQVFNNTDSKREPPQGGGGSLSRSEKCYLCLVITCLVPVVLL